ncbi:hypothetical protein EU244_027475 [Rhodococcus qingshengii]|uniref:hypothetical protein n=1 Tax=Rhodococcus qingshengii TaxID=334542 RepID=UPI0010A5B074|nr:hypothetical protein [Rhodococcus qingshengii]THJ66378.1 hypothetical protein EU244_28145 [Rhodococcus qingshengii]
MNRPGDSPPPADRRINFAFTRDVASNPAASSGAIPAPPARTFRRYPPERMRPGQQIPATIAQSATLVAGDDMAIWINGFTVYDTGLAFRIEGRIRNSTPSTQVSATLLGPLNVGRMTRPHSNESIQLTLTFQDGTTVSSVGSNQLVPDDPTAPWLDGGGASSSRLASHADYFLTPLPPAGPLLIEIAYPHFDIPATRTTVDLSELSSASDNVIRLWHNDTQKR